MNFNNQILTLFILAITVSSIIFAMDAPPEPAKTENTISQAEQEMLNKELFEASSRFIFHAKAVCTAKNILARGAQINAIDDNGLTSLAWGAMFGNEELCQLLLDHNAQTETKGENGVEPLFAATCRGYPSIMKLLLDHGARIDARDARKETVITVSLRLYRSIGTLLVYPMFNPFLPEQQFKISRQRIWTALSVFQRLCPTVPKDVRKLILSAHQELKEDLSNSAACGIHNNLKIEQTLNLSFPVLRLLAQNNRLPQKEMIAAIKAHHFKCIKPLMLEAMPLMREAMPADELRAMLNPARLEENFGKAIEQNIKIRLGLLSKTEDTTDSEKSSKCSLQ